jgi:hypothetical protein
MAGEAIKGSRELPQRVLLVAGTDGMGSAGRLDPNCRPADAADGAGLLPASPAAACLGDCPHRVAGTDGVVATITLCVREPGRPGVAKRACIKCV